LCGYEHTTGDTRQVVSRAVEARRSGARAMVRGGIAMVAAVPLFTVVLPVIPIAALLLPLSLFGGTAMVRGWRRYREAGRRMRRMLPMARVVDR
jgi:hypothetical protein